MAFPAFWLKIILPSLFRLPREELWPDQKISNELLSYFIYNNSFDLFTTGIHISIPPVLSYHEIARKWVNPFSILWEHLDHPSWLFFAIYYFICSIGILYVFARCIQFSNPNSFSFSVWIYLICIFPYSCVIVHNCL